MFNLGDLKVLWKNGEQKEVGRREMALMAAYADKPYRAACLEISALGGMPWINDSLPFEHMRVRDGQLLLRSRGYHSAHSLL